MRKLYSYVVVGQKYTKLQCSYGAAFGHNRDEGIGFATSTFRKDYPDFSINIFDATLVMNVPTSTVIENGELVQWN